MRVISWGDFPTWALAVIALLALVAATAAYFKQANAARDVSEQVRLQRKALAEQQKINEKQIEVMAAQLGEIKQRTEAIERQQADAVTLTSLHWSGDFGLHEAGEPVYMALAANGSLRPIRHVACRLRTVPDVGTYEPEGTGRYIPAEPLASVIGEPDARTLEGTIIPEDPYTTSTEMRLLRAGDTAALVFDLVVNPDLEERLTLRFSDDAGRHWQIDHDDHLQKLDNRDDW
jgi:hypothetical protein